MAKQTVAIIFVLVMVATIVTVDLTLFRHQFRERLLSNVGIVLIFMAVYLRFLQR